MKGMYDWIDMMADGDKKNNDRNITREIVSNMAAMKSRLIKESLYLHQINT
jgi:hypothetical protein